MSYENLRDTGCMPSPEVYEQKTQGMIDNERCIRDQAGDINAMTFTIMQKLMGERPIDPAKDTPIVNFKELQMEIMEKQ